MQPHRPVISLQALDLVYAPRPWAFASERRAEIDAYFETLKRDNPALWNGRVLLMHNHDLHDDVLHGAYLQTDFASFLAWRDWDFPDRSMHNAFALGALRGSDGVFLLGVMAAHTANAGKIYFPGGTPEPADIADGRVDLERSVRREIREETGIEPAAFAIGPQWHMVPAGPRIALIKIMLASEPAHQIRAQILRHIAAQSHPELADMRLVRGPGDFTPAMPDFMMSFLNHIWR